MKSSRILAGALIGALLVSLAPKPMALADGAASTRNILIGGAAAAAAALIIINHNKQVHARYAADAQAQAALAEQANNNAAAAAQYKRAYQHEVALATELKKEVAIKDQQLARLNSVVSPGSSNFVAAKPVANAAASNNSAQVVSYGWGSF